MASLVNLGAAHRRLEAEQKPGCGYGIWEETAACMATHCCCKMQCFLGSADINKVIELSMNGFITYLSLELNEKPGVCTHLYHF